MFFVLSYKNIQRFLSRTSGGMSPRFSFLKNGELSLEISKTPSTKSFYIGLFQIDMHDKVKNYISNQKNLCALNLTSINSENVFESSNNSFFAKINIPSTNTYFAALSSCDSNISNFTVTFSYKNPETLLSNDEKPLILIKLISLIIYGITFIFCFFFFLYKKYPKSPFFFLFITSSLLLIISRLISFIVLSIADKKDISNTFHILNLIINYFADALFISTLILSPVGLPNTIRSPRTQKIIHLISSTFLMALPILLFGDGRQVGQEGWIKIISSLWIHMCFVASYKLIYTSIEPLIKKTNEVHFKPEPYDLTGTKSNEVAPIENTPQRAAIIKQFWQIDFRLVNLGLFFTFYMAWILIPYPPNKACWISNLILDCDLILCYELQFLIMLFTKEEEDFIGADEDILLTIKDKIEEKIDSEEEQLSDLSVKNEQP